MLYANIIVDIPHVKLDKPFTYSIPEFMESEIQVGMRVLVPFGRGDNMIDGIVLGITEELSSDERNMNIKEVQFLLDKNPVLTQKQISLVFWMRERYLCKFVDAIRTIIPSGLSTKSEKYIILKKEISYSESLGDEIVDYMNSRKRMSLDRFIKKFSKFYEKSQLKREINKLVNSEDIFIDEVYKQSVNIAYRKYVYLNYDDYDNAIEVVGNRATKQIEILRYLNEVKTLGRDDEFLRFEYKDLLEKFNTSSQTLKGLENKGIIKIKEEEYERKVIDEDIKKYSKHELNDEQRSAFNRITCGDEKIYLLKGVTGSGKTEVYLQLIEEVINKGQDAIVLVPEIALTPQTVERFAGRFKNRVAIYHSNLSFGERYDQWRKIREGKVQIVVGTRSALFMPFENLGIIIIDEEHETSYKSEMNPKYESIEVAEKLISLNYEKNAKLVLGSATPSIKSYFRSEKQDYKLIELHKRVMNIKMPEVRIVDMREELLNGNKTIFSYDLYNNINDRLKKGEQTILFLNSRGFSKAVSCRECGYTIRCDSCDISMNFHMRENIMVCHYCGQTKKVPEKCPECDSKYIRYMGIGTQKVEIEARKYFPGARVARMDADTMSQKGSYERIYSMMKDKRIDILIGTQMVSKGFDFPDVTLVGIIMADISLNIPDYSSAERTFQLITQVSGRAGRAGKDSDVVIQTYNPDNYAIRSSMNSDYKSFYTDEIKIRKAYGYPPFSELIDITVYGRDENRVYEEVHRIHRAIYEEKSKNFIIKNTHILGPNMASIYKIKDRYRWKILIKTDKDELDFIKDIVRKYCLVEKAEQNSDIIVSVDVNPRTVL